MKTPEEMEKVYSIQRSMFDKFRQVPKEGKLIDYLGREFLVLPGVFWPGEDSKALVRNYVINEGEEVCDVCTGSGIIAIHSASKGASKVVALDINPQAIMATKHNAQWYGLNSKIDARVSDVFSALERGEKFDVVTMNSPFTDHKEESGEFVEKSIWDQDLHVHKSFFSGLNGVLKQNERARAYVAHSSFGAIDSMKELADKYNFSVKEIGRNIVDDLRTFYAFELRRKK